MECCCYLRNVQDLQADDKTLYERRWHHGGISSHFYKRPVTNLVGQFYLEYSLDTHCMPGEFGRERSLVADIDEPENLDASEIHARRLDAEDVKTRNMLNIFPIADGTVKLSAGDHGIRKCTSMRDQTVRGEELSGNLRGNSDVSQPTDTMMDDREAGSDFWSTEGNLHWSSSHRTKSSAPRA